MPSTFSRRFSMASYSTNAAGGIDAAVSEKDTELYPARPRHRKGNTQDHIDMQRMGKRQELNRKFQFLSTVGFASYVLGT
ncbi:uncharacterized protein LTR77_009069 [Saxophila tyrrhenica]|uniref:Uncharacterized protein n=1 Tax=Saxophila tyrrhenica TaxID=1690608 RepID=A0AAV9P0D6_9PEZI|nr:hypothetical protein LTR77_009069 [Saxophila tyrrhenica]